MAMSSPIRMSQQRPIDKEFEDADDNGVLNLSGRNLRMFPNVPGELCDFADVFEADFSKNRLDRIPDEVCNFRALVKLNCYHNSIRFVPYELSDLQNLQELDLSRNFLQQIPPELCKMNLTSLNLSNNRLVSLPLELGKLALLRHLDLSCNLLPDLPNSICQLSSLQHLDLHRNELKDIPSDICVLPLMYLDISSNFLCRLPTTLRLIASLFTLRVADNPLESPPTQVCVRGLVHIFKYLESLEKRGSDPHLLSLSARDETLRRRKEHSNKKQSNRPMSESTPLHNGRDHPLDLYHEMVSFVNTTIGDDPALFKNEGEVTPTGAKHWSVAQFMTPDKVTASHHDSSHGQTQPSHKEIHNPPRMTDQSKEEYREAAHRLYMEQERQKRKLQKFKSSSPPPSSTSFTTPHSTQSSSHFGTLPKSEGSKGDGRTREGVRPKVVGRSLPNERYPRSGSWNSHMRISSPALPSKYSTPPPERARSDPDEERGMEEMGEEQRQRTKQATREAVRDFVIKRASHSATDLRSTSTEVPPQPPPKRRPPPLNTAQPSTPTDHHQTPHNDAVSPASSREGSITPTNEPPPMEVPLEEPMTPKDSSKRLSYSMDDLLEVGERGGEGGGRKVTFSSTDNLVISPSPDRDMKQSPPKEQQQQLQQPEKWGAKVEGRKERSVSATDSTVVIEDLETSPTQKKRLLSAGDTETPYPADSTWPNLKSPQRKKDKDVFRFLSQQSDPNYTVRRHQLQMSRILEKNQHVKKSIEAMMGVQLSDDIGDWIMDGVLVCQVVNKLHPGTINTIHTTTEGQPLPLAKRTMNIAAFVTACRKLKIPEEELCSAGDIMELKDPLRVITCLQRVLETAQ